VLFLSISTHYISLSELHAIVTRVSHTRKPAEAGGKLSLTSVGLSLGLLFYPEYEGDMFL
jgi:hypothetical protein